MVDSPDEDILRAHRALVRSDHPFKRQGRLRQALWREKRGYPVGLHRGRPLGSRLKMPEAERHLWNYLTDGARRTVRAALGDSERFIQAPRIYDDLLSSQPLCFNLFGELALDLNLATRVLRRLLPDSIGRVIRVEFEHSPGRGSLRYTADHSAFDVYVEHVTPAGDPGFIGIEVKYVEDMSDKPARHRERYDEIADRMACFRPEERRRLRAVPLNQLWRDHLLAGSMLVDPTSRWGEGRFVVLYPRENDCVDTAVRVYSSCLSNQATFGIWTLGAFIDALQVECNQDWVAELRERYMESSLPAGSHPDPHQR